MYRLTCNTDTFNMPVTTRAMLRNKQVNKYIEEPISLSLEYPDFITPPRTPDGLIVRSPPPAPRRHLSSRKLPGSIIRMNREEKRAIKFVYKLRCSYSKFVEKLIEVEHDIKRHDMRMFYLMFPKDELEHLQKVYDNFNDEVSDFVKMNVDDWYHKHEKFCSDDDDPF